jgi:hypothetical protein
MALKFPVLDNYEDMWPLDCIVISLLKYCTSQSKASSIQKIVDALQNTVQTATLATHS